MSCAILIDTIIANLLKRTNRDYKNSLYKIDFSCFVTMIMYVLGIICIFAALTAMLTSFITNSTFSVKAQQTAGVNVSIVKDALSVPLPVQVANLKINYLRSKPIRKESDSLFY